MAKKKKDVIDETYEFVESALPLPDITVNVEQRVKNKFETGKMRYDEAIKFLWEAEYEEKHFDPIAFYHVKTNTIVINDLVTKNFDKIIKIIDHEYIHAALHGLGLHTESPLLDAVHGSEDTMDKGGV